MSIGKGVKGWHNFIELEEEGGRGGGEDDNKHDEIGNICWVIEYVESICSIVSDWIIVGRDDKSSLIGGSKQKQCGRYVMVFNNIKRSGI